MRRVSSLIVALTFMCGASLSTARAAQDEMVPNPPYKHWSAFKVGTTVTQREHQKFGKDTDEADYYAGGTRGKDSTYTLLEVTPEKVVVQLVITEYSAGSATELAPLKITFPSTARKSRVATSKHDIEEFKEGDEEITVLGKPVKCHWIELTDKDGDETFYHKMWESDEIPGGIVKEIKTTKKGDAVTSESEYSVHSFSKS